MKTLDEVIDDFEKACDLERRCEGCSGCLGHEEGCPNDGAESIPDALHYLKEYQRYQKTPSRNGHMALVDYFEEQQKNEPLDWEQLKQMEGKPVWVKTENCGAHWYIIESIDDDMIIVIGKYCERINYYRDDDFIRWQAYRKERE